MTKTSIVCAKASLAGLMLWGLMGWAIPANAQVDDFPDVLRVSDQVFERVSTATLTRGWVFKVFNAALYLGNEYTLEDYGKANIPIHLVIEYERKLSRKLLIETADRILIDLHGEARYAEFSENIACLNYHYQTVQRGDRYALTYLPGLGLELSFNGEPKVGIENDDFARYYLSVWLGNHPDTRSLAEQLLGQVSVGNSTVSSN